MPSLSPGRAKPPLAIVLLGRVLTLVRVVLFLTFAVLVRALVGNRVVPPPPARNLPAEVERR
jgi:hypothetical protein